MPTPPATTPVPSSIHRNRLDARGVTASGTDGYETAQRILRDLANHAFGQSLPFGLAVVAADLPAQWAWHLEVVPVPCPPAEQRARTV